VPDHTLPLEMHSHAPRQQPAIRAYGGAKVCSRPPVTGCATAVAGCTRQLCAFAAEVAAARGYGRAGDGALAVTGGTWHATDGRKSVTLPRRRASCCRQFARPSHTRRPLRGGLLWMTHSSGSMQATRGLTPQRPLGGEVRAVRRRWHAPHCAGGQPTKPKPRIVYRCGAASTVRWCGKPLGLHTRVQGSGVEGTVQCTEAVRGGVTQCVEEGAQRALAGGAAAVTGPHSTCRCTATPHAGARRPVRCQLPLTCTSPTLPTHYVRSV
jgi:hypothetical protein